MNVDTIKSAVDSFLNIDNPNYAIMINGNWGSGKTYFIKEYINNLSDNENTYEHIYVSLNGASSSEDIKDRIITAITGLKSVSNETISNFGNLFSSITKAFENTKDASSIGAIASIISSPIKNKLLERIDNNWIVVFDDLERASMEKHDVLSYLNTFVEHQGSKVLILCDESKIECNKYKEQKEKVVQHTYLINHSPEDISEICFKSISLSTDRLYTESKRIFVDLIKKLDCKNIRTLNYAVKCFKSITDNIISQYQTYDIEKETIPYLYYCTAFSIGLKEYRLSTDDLYIFANDQRFTSFYMKSKDNETDKPESFTQTYQFYQDIYRKLNFLDSSIISYNQVCFGYYSEIDLDNEVKRLLPVKLSDEDIFIYNNYQSRADEFESISIDIISKIESLNLHIDSPNKALKLIENMYIFIEHKAIPYNLDKFKSICKTWIINNLDNDNFLIDEYILIKNDVSNSYIKELAGILISNFNKTRNIKTKQKYESILLDVLESNDPDRVEILESKWDNNNECSFINNSYIDVLLSVIPNSNFTQIDNFTRFITTRYKPINIRDFLEDELPSLSKFRDSLNEMILFSDPSLKTYELVILHNRIHDIIGKLSNSVDKPDNQELTG